MLIKHWNMLFFLKKLNFFKKHPHNSILIIMWSPNHESIKSLRIGIYQYEFINTMFIKFIIRILKYRIYIVAIHFSADLFKIIENLTQPNDIARSWFFISRNVCSTLITWLIEHWMEWKEKEIQRRSNKVKAQKKKWRDQENRKRAVHVLFQKNWNKRWERNDITVLCYDDLHLPLD